MEPNGRAEGPYGEPVNPLAREIKAKVESKKKTYFYLTSLSEIFPRDEKSIALKCI